MTHLQFDDISAIADGAEADANGRVHLERCAECRETLRKVRELVSVAQALPRDVSPPSEVWAALRSRVGVASRTGTTPRRRVSVAWVAAAAAVVLIAGSVVMLPPRRGKSQKVIAPESRAVQNVERNYTSTLSQLRETLDSQRVALAPTTVSVVDRSLATIDTAIAETRSALSADPGNPALVEILSSHYERKVELLQRATELAPSF